MHVSCAWLLFSVVTVFVCIFDLSSCVVLVQHIRKTWRALSGLAGAITADMWQLLEEHSYLSLIFEGLSAAVAVAC